MPAVDVRPAGAMQHEEQPRVGMKIGGLEAVEQIMRGNYKQRDGHPNEARHAHESGEQNHGEPQAADDAEHAPAGMKGPRKTDHREFQYDEPHAARHQKYLEPASRMLLPVETRAHARKEKKRRRAEVRDPPDQKIEGPGMVDVFRFEGNVAG